jgi:hypothetical protein
MRDKERVIPSSWASLARPGTDMLAGVRSFARNTTLLDVKCGGAEMFGFLDGCLLVDIVIDKVW